MWRNGGGSRYQRVQVLMVYWAEDDLGVIDEIDMLGDVFCDLHQYEVSVYIIPSYQTDCVEEEGNSIRGRRASGLPSNILLCSAHVLQP